MSGGSDRLESRDLRVNNLGVDSNYSQLSWSDNLASMRLDYEGSLEEYLDGLQVTQCLLSSQRGVISTITTPYPAVPSGHLASMPSVTVSHPFRWRF